MERCHYCGTEATGATCLQCYMDEATRKRSAISFLGSLLVSALLWMFVIRGIWLLVLGFRSHS